MTTTLSFFAEGLPKGQPRPRAFARKFGDKWSARVYDAGTAEGWKSAVALAAKPHLPSEPLTGALCLSVNFHMPRPKAHFRKNGDVKEGAPGYPIGKPDADNLVKAVLDCLTQLGVWRDDTQIVYMHVRKVYGAPTTGAWVDVRPAEGCR